MPTTSSQTSRLLALLALALVDCSFFDTAQTGSDVDGTDALNGDGGDATDVDGRGEGLADLAGWQSPDFPPGTDLTTSQIPAIPAAWYRFDEAAGPVIDSSQFHNDGVAEGQGVVRGAAGHIGQCITFTGSGGHVRVPASVSLDMMTGGTVEYWLKLTSVGMGLVGSEVSRGTGNGDDNILLNSDCGNQQAIFSRAAGGSDDVTSSCNTIAANVWAHMAVSNDGQTIRLYVNAALIKASGGGGGDLGALHNDLYIGQREQGEYPLSGALDELKWWTVARSQTDICSDGGGSWNGQKCIY